MIKLIILLLLSSYYQLIKSFVNINMNLNKINPNTIFKSYNNIQYNSAYSYIAALNYNPFNIAQKSFITNFTVEPNSIYINYKLSKEQINDIQKNIPDYLSLIPIKLLKYDRKKYIISVNVYNVTSFLFGNNMIPRLECNIYIKDKRNNNIGTMIIAYTTSATSFDPINLLKFGKKENLEYNIKENLINIKSNEDTFTFETNLNIKNKKLKYISNDLIKATDNIYYQNGIIEKIFYDSSFIYNTVNLLKIKEQFNMLNFIIPGSNKELFFNKIDSIFLFPNKIYFTCKTWSNRNNI